MDKTYPSWEFSHKFSLKEALFLYLFFSLCISIISSFLYLLELSIFHPGEVLKFNILLGTWNMSYVVNIPFSASIVFAVIYQKNWTNRHYLLIPMILSLSFLYPFLFTLIFPAFLATRDAYKLDINKYKIRLDAVPEFARVGRIILYLGRLLSMMTILIYLAVVVANIKNGTESPFTNLGLIPFMVIFGIHGLAILIVDHGRKLIIASRPLSWNEASDSLVLYLRSFNSDSQNTRLENVLPMLIPPLLLFSFGVTTMEEDLSAIFSKIGKFIAIGNPSDILPSLGAEKIYIFKEKWQDKVALMLRKADLVVLSAGTSEGLLWELKACVDYVPPEKILLYIPFQNSFFPNDKSSRDKAYKQYSLFREKANQILPCSLPKEIDESRFLFFGRLWEPCIVKPIPRWKQSFSLSGSMQNNTKNELRMFLSRISKST